MKSICIFCGSTIGNSPAVVEAAKATGQAIAQQGLTLIYGGLKVGLMGAVADAALHAGGQVIGVVPKFFAERGLAHEELTELHIVENMHERKAKMSALADAFIALPGGAGTFEEIFEQWTWMQLGIHHKPCAFLNVEGFYDAVLHLIQTSIEHGLTEPRYAKKLVVAADIQGILQSLTSYIPEQAKWDDVNLSADIVT